MKVRIYGEINTVDSTQTAKDRIFRILLDNCTLYSTGTVLYNLKGTNEGSFAFEETPSQ